MGMLEPEDCSRELEEGRDDDLGRDEGAARTMLTSRTPGPAAGVTTSSRTCAYSICQQCALGSSFLSPLLFLSRASHLGIFGAKDHTDHLRHGFASHGLTRYRQETITNIQLP